MADLTLATRRQAAAILSFASFGLLASFAGWRLGGVGPLPPAAHAGQGFLLVAAAWFLFALLTEAAAQLRTGLGSGTARGLLFLLSIPMLALAARSALSAQGSGTHVVLPLAVVLVSAGGILLTAAFSEIPSPSRLPRLAVADARAMLGSRRGRALLALVGILIAGSGAAWARAAQDEAEARIRARSAYVSWFEKQQRVASPRLREEGKVVVAKFSDYQCPPCRASYERLEPLIHRLAMEQPGRFRLLTLDYPLDPSCNESVHAAIHPAACEAAVAVRLARRQGRSSAALESWLFGHQRELSRDSVWDAAERLASVRDAPEERAAALAAIREDVRLGTALGLQSTPTFFVNGVRIEGVVPADQFEAVIRVEALRLGAPSN